MRSSVKLVLRCAVSILLLAVLVQRAPASSLLPRWDTDVGGRRAAPRPAGAAA